MRHLIRLRHIAIACCALALASSFTVAAADAAFAPSGGRQIVSIGHDAVLGPGESAAQVVAVFGSSIAQGEVSDSVVAVFGDARVTGSVDHRVVAVLGNAYIDGTVHGNVVDVFGAITLGPHAAVSGRVVNVLGSVSRSSSATVERGVESVLSLPFSASSWLPQWLRRCLIYGRLLAVNAEVAWAWGLALAALGFYLLLAALFGDALGRCAGTLETYPGRSILTALLAILISPVIYLALLVTIVGIALLPVVWTGFFLAGVFGKAAALAWLGRRCLPSRHPDTRARTVLEVLVGGLILLGLYLIPVVGFAAFTVFGLLGLGAVLYTLILAASAARPPVAASAGSFADSTSARDGPQAGPAPQPDSPDPAHGSPSGDRFGPSSAPASGVTIDESTLARAGFWIRMGALALDALLVAIVLGVLHDAVRLELILLAAYGAVMWKVKGTTVGGIVCDLKVTRVDGRPLDWGTAIVRALGCFLSLAVAGLGFVWIALDPNHQAWHDKIAGTLVVRVPRGTPLV